jgi:hypothetical protein
MFMFSLHVIFGAHWDHEPRAWSADLQVGAFGARHTAPSWSSALRFKVREGSFDFHDQGRIEVLFDVFL